MMKISKEKHRRESYRESTATPAAIYVDTRIRLRRCFFPHFPSRKGFTHTDYIVAIAIFIFMFGIAVYFMNSYLSGLDEDAGVTAATNNALLLLSVADFGEPESWPELDAGSNTVLLLHFSENTTAAGGVTDSANGRNGTVNGDPYYNISGRFGSSFMFNGDDYISLQGFGKYTRWGNKQK